MTKTEIEFWKAEKKRYQQKGWSMERYYDRLAHRRAGFVGGREFGETCDSYIKRKGMKEFYDYKF